MKRFAMILSVLLLLSVLLCIFVAATAEEPEAVPIDEIPTDAEALPMNGDLTEEIVEARDLQSGDEGDDVLELQIRLTELYYYEGTLSGHFGEATRNAVLSFQEDFELDVTGVADQETQSMLFAAQYRPLRYGSDGEDVKALQTRLTDLGYYTGKISGNYLEATQTAIRQFQANNGLGEDGIADVGTQEVLFSGDALSKNNVAVPTATPRPGSGFLVDDDAEGDGLYIDAYVAYSRKLKNGSTGTLVKQLQTRLTELGYYTGPISGNFLGKTTTAVKKFQKQNGLTANGTVEEDTWNLIFNDPSVLLPEDTPRPTPTPTPVPFAITVDVNNQVTTVYGRDENGDYTVVVRQMLCSTGNRSTPSDVGDWVLGGRKANWCYFPKFGSYARYWTNINGSIAFHSVIYNSVSVMDMDTKSYKKLGNRASHGCIRLTVADAKWIYDNVGKGTVVTITEKLPADPELRASLKLPPLNYKTMKPEETPQPTAEPAYTKTGMPPLPLKKLKKNSSGEEVYWLQRKLADLGYYKGKCSGTYLDGTVKAVKAFEKANGLGVDGEADVKMQEKLYADVLHPATAVPTAEVLATPAPENPS